MLQKEYEKSKNFYKFERESEEIEKILEKDHYKFYKHLMELDHEKELEALQQKKKAGK